MAIHLTHLLSAILRTILCTVRLSRGVVRGCVGELLRGSVEALGMGVLRGCLGVLRGCVGVLLRGSVEALSGMGVLRGCVGVLLRGSVEALGMGVLGGCLSILGLLDTELGRVATV